MSTWRLQDFKVGLADWLSKRRNQSYRILDFYFVEFTISFGAVDAHGIGVFQIGTKIVSRPNGAKVEKGMLYSYGLDNN